jgi:hypothetical protein
MIYIEKEKTRRRDSGERKSRRGDRYNICCSKESHEDVIATIETAEREIKTVHNPIRTIKRKDEKK